MPSAAADALGQAAIIRKTAISSSKESSYTRGLCYAEEVRICTSDRKAKRSTAAGSDGDRVRRSPNANESSSGRPRADGVGAATVTRTGRSCSAHTSCGSRRRRRLFGGREPRPQPRSSPGELSCPRSPRTYAPAARRALAPAHRPRVPALSAHLRDSSRASSRARAPARWARALRAPARRAVVPALSSPYAPAQVPAE